MVMNCSLIGKHLHQPLALWAILADSLYSSEKLKGGLSDISDTLCSTATSEVAMVLLSVLRALTQLCSTLSAINCSGFA